MRDVAVSCGYTPVETLLDVLEEHDKINDELIASKEQIERLSSVLADGLGIDPSRIVDGRITTGSVPSSDELPESTEGSTDISEERTESSDESSSVEGSTDVHSSSDNDDSFLRDALKF